MAKLKAPLLSLGASGALGKVLVFFNWKGLDVVREYVVPANPQTTAQTTQRDYLKDGVAMIHTAQAHAHPMVEADQIAYSTLAAIGDKIMTWFNQAIKLWIKVKVAGNTPVIYHEWAFADLDRTAFNINCYIQEETGSDLADGKFYFGTRRTNLFRPVVATIPGGTVVQIPPTDLSAWMVVGTKYYVQFRPDVADDCEGANSGIYSFVAE